ncbi:MAG: HAMP domain-containing sensor histidine kinase, partial [Bacteroidota bacterium]
FAGMLQKRLDPKNDLAPRDHQCIHTITQSSDSMMNLIDDLLTHAKASAKKDITFEELPLDEVLDAVLLNLKSQIDENNITIHRCTLPAVRVVPTKINQVFQNIISNAIKFKKKETPLTVHINCEDKGAHWQVAIEDNGIGIEKKDQEKIFTPFKKLHHEREYAGSGIGLATCKKIVEMHQGTIWVESEKNIGTKFIFTLPSGQCN